MGKRENRPSSGQMRRILILLCVVKMCEPTLVVIIRFVDSEETGKMAFAVVGDKMVNIHPNGGFRRLRDNWAMKLEKRRLTFEQTSYLNGLTVEKREEAVVPKVQKHTANGQHFVTAFVGSGDVSEKFAEKLGENPSHHDSVEKIAELISKSYMDLHDTNPSWHYIVDRNHVYQAHFPKRYGRELLKTSDSPDYSVRVVDQKNLYAKGHGWEEMEASLQKYTHDERGEERGWNNPLRISRHAVMEDLARAYTHVTNQQNPDHIWVSRSHEGHILHENGETEHFDRNFDSDKEYYKYERSHRQLLKRLMREGHYEELEFRDQWKQKTIAMEALDEAKEESMARRKKAKREGNEKAAKAEAEVWETLEGYERDMEASEEHYRRKAEEKRKKLLQGDVSEKTWKILERGQGEVEGEGPSGRRRSKSREGSRGRRRRSKSREDDEPMASGNHRRQNDGGQQEAEQHGNGDGRRRRSGSRNRGRNGSRDGQQGGGGRSHHQHHHSGGGHGKHRSGSRRRSNTPPKKPIYSSRGGG